MDWPLVYRLNRQVHGRVAKSGRDKRWRHLSVKPPSRWDIPPSGVRPLEDYKVDRAEVEVWQHMELTVTNRSRAWLKSGWICMKFWKYKHFINKKLAAYLSTLFSHIGDWSNGMIGVSKTFGGSSILSSPVSESSQSHWKWRVASFSLFTNLKR